MASPMLNTNANTDNEPEKKESVRGWEIIGNQWDSKGRSRLEELENKYPDGFTVTDVDENGNERTSFYYNEESFKEKNNIAPTERPKEEFVIPEGKKNPYDVGQYDIKDNTKEITDRLSNIESQADTTKKGQREVIVKTPSGEKKMPGETSDYVIIDNPDTPAGQMRLQGLMTEYKDGYPEETLGGSIIFHKRKVETDVEDEKSPLNYKANVSNPKTELQRILSRKSLNYDAHEPYINEKDEDGKYKYSDEELFKLRTEFEKLGDKEAVSFLTSAMNKRPEYTKKIAIESGSYDMKSGGEYIVSNEDLINLMKEYADSPDKKAEVEKELKSRGVDYSDTPEEAAKEAIPAQNAVLSEKNEVLNRAIEEAQQRVEDLDGDFEKLRKKAEKELENKKDTANLSEFLPGFAIQKYLEGEFGERGTLKSIGTLAYFILDKIGAALANAGAGALRMTPTAKSALSVYNETRMKDALKRDDSVRAKEAEESINNIIKDYDALRKANLDTLTLGNDTISKFLEQYADQVDSVALIKLLEQEADLYNKLPKDKREELFRIQLLKSTNPSEAVLALADDYQYMIEASVAETTAQKEEALNRQSIARAQSAIAQDLTNAQLNELKAKVNNLIQANNLTVAQEAEAWRKVKLIEKQLDWADANSFTALLTAISGLSFFK